MRESWKWDRYWSKDDAKIKDRLKTEDVQRINDIQGITKRVSEEAGIPRHADEETWIKLTGKKIITEMMEDVVGCNLIGYSTVDNPYSGDYSEFYFLCGNDLKVLEISTQGESAGCPAGSINYDLHKQKK